MAVIIDRDSQIPMYEQIYMNMRNDILSGLMKEGEKLPSKRVLAERLRVSKITVENAYAQLIAEGYVRSTERSGYYVQYTGGAFELPKAVKPNGNIRNIPVVDTVKEEGNLEMFPFSVWSRLMRSVISEKGTALLKSVRNGGAYELRSAISGYLYRSKGFYQPPERIIVGSGSEYMYNMLIQFIGGDKKYGYENPGLVNLSKIFALNRIDCSPIKIDEQGLKTSELYEKKIQVAHTSPAHQYPTGIVMPISRRREIMRWMEDTGGYVIEDDYDGEFRWSGKPIPTMFGADRTGRIIYMKTFSQTISPTIRISYICLSEELYELWCEKLGFYSCSVPVLEQYTLAEFISGGFYERNINRSRKHYRKIRDLLLQKAASCSEFKFYGTDAGLHIVFRIPEYNEKVDSYFKRCRLVVRRLSDFCLDGIKCDDDLFVVYFANAIAEEILK